MFHHDHRRNRENVIMASAGALTVLNFLWCRLVADNAWFYRRAYSRRDVSLVK